MSWLAKSVLYSALLAWPGHLLAPAYQALLLTLTGFVLGVHLPPPADHALDLSASNVLTIFVALCLGSDFAAWKRRGKAIALGLPLLVALEVATGVLGMRLASLGEPPHDRLSWALAARQSLDLARWLGVPLVWMAFFGPQVLALRSATPSSRAREQHHDAGVRPADR